MLSLPPSLPPSLPHSLTPPPSLSRWSLGDWVVGGAFMLKRVKAGRGPAEKGPGLGMDARRGGRFLSS